jgi:cytochrome c biogenesis protein CcmG/thiol:disulfide interchange protein DsbE
MALALVAVAWMAVFLLRNQTQPGAPALETSAPSFELITLDGEIVRLADLAGHGVVLNFWASWCLPCQTEAALLQQAWQRHGQRHGDAGVRFVGIAYLDRAENAQAFLDHYGVTYPNALDSQGEWSRRYALRGVPETFFITPDGILVDHVQGPILTLADLERRIKKIDGR